ncbi:hypothetical protein ABT127_30645 [Streptomyces sp. NPDC001904]|uniref:hypothetical protein n=1 Tax=Streptomyces sp. NPDC001904 TaxID=3154531 RepID=UPI0033238DFE
MSAPHRTAQISQVGVAEAFGPHCDGQVNCVAQQPLGALPARAHRAVSGRVGGAAVAIRHRLLACCGCGCGRRLLGMLVHPALLDGIRPFLPLAGMLRAAADQGLGAAGGLLAQVLLEDAAPLDVGQVRQLAGDSLGRGVAAGAAQVDDVLTVVAVIAPGEPAARREGEGDRLGEPASMPRSPRPPVIATTRRACRP